MIDTTQNENDVLPNGPVISDSKVEKKSQMDKLASIFLTDDLDRIGGRIVQEAIIPNVVDVAKKILHKTIDVAFGASSNSSGSLPASNMTVYNSYSKNNYSTTSQVPILSTRSGVYDYSEVRFRSQKDVQDVVRNLRAVIRTQGKVSVGKYLEFTNNRTIPNDYSYGWTQLDNDVYMQETGDPEYPYRLVLPPVVALRNNDRIYL
jgi:hypothetical protein